MSDADQTAADHRLEEARATGHAPDIAAALHALASQLAATGRRAEALPAAEEATDLYRRLAAEHPGAFDPPLAAALNDLGVLLADAGRPDDALAAGREAVEVRRRLADTQPEAYDPDLASSLSNLATDLAAAGHRDEALAAAEEAVRRLSPHFLREPRAYAEWMQKVSHGYLKRCQESGIEFDAELLHPIAVAFYRLRGGDVG